MGKATDVRPKITMACEDCKERNYITKKNRRNDPDRLEVKKFCARCNKHTLHKAGCPIFFDIRAEERPKGCTSSLWSLATHVVQRN